MTNSPVSEPCPICELGLAQTLRVVSRHTTSAGVVVYARCDCGRLSMWLESRISGPPTLTSMASDRADDRQLCRS